MAYKDGEVFTTYCDKPYTGNTYRMFFENNHFDRLLCMTATLPEEMEYKELLQEIAPTAYKITLDRCVKLGIVSPYEITCVPVELTEEEIDQIAEEVEILRRMLEA